MAPLFAVQFSHPEFCFFFLNTVPSMNKIYPDAATALQGVVRDGQLIGTGGTAVTAGIPFQELYGPGGIGIFQQLAESQGIAGTAAYEMDVMQFAVF